MPTTPQNAAGRMIEPTVCVPTASGHMKSATAAAEPLDDDPGVCSGSCGLRVLPGHQKPKREIAVLPSSTGAFLAQPLNARRVALGPTAGERRFVAP